MSLIPSAGNGQCLGWRAGPDKSYQWMSYQQVWIKCMHVVNTKLDLDIRCMYLPVHACLFVNFQVEDAATQFGAGLVQFGIETGQDVFVGLYSRNCTEV